MHTMWLRMFPIMSITCSPKSNSNHIHGVISCCRHESVLGFFINIVNYYQVFLLTNSNCGLICTSRMCLTYSLFDPTMDGLADGTDKQDPLSLAPVLHCVILDWFISVARLTLF